MKPALGFPLSKELICIHTDTDVQSGVLAYPPQSFPKSQTHPSVPATTANTEAVCRHAHASLPVSPQIRRNSKSDFPEPSVGPCTPLQPSLRSSSQDPRFPSHSHLLPPNHSGVAPATQYPKASSANTIADLQHHLCQDMPTWSSRLNATPALPLTTLPCFVILPALITIWNFFKKPVLICFPVAAINTMTKRNRRRKEFISAYNLWSIIKES